MQFSTEPLDGGAFRLAIDGEMTIYNVVEIKQQLLDAVQHDRLELDLSHVTELDSAGLQLLILAKRESQRHGKLMTITAHSDAVREVIEFCDMAGFFGDPIVIPAEARS